MSLTYVKTLCHCGLNTFQVAFDTSTLPQATDMCHCNPCRHSTGKLALNAAVPVGAPLSVDSGPGTPQKPGDLSKLAKYNAMGPVLTRYFCSGCGAFMFIEYKPNDKTMWLVSTGVLERTDGIAKSGYHAFVADTRDGGLAEHCQKLDGKVLPRYVKYEDSETIPIGWREDKDTKMSASKKAPSEERLEAYCQCKNIQVHLTRATPAQAADPSQWWLIPGSAKDPTARVRFMAGHDVCTSCRLTGGCLITSWATVPRTNVIDNRTSLPVSFLEDNKKSSAPRRIPLLTQYQSSPGTFREFCGTCGATAFVWSRKKKSGQASESIGEEPAVINVGVGLFNEKQDGARAESWCFWSPSVSHAADALDVTGKDALQATLDHLSSKL